VGDVADARATVAALIDSFGFDPVEVSPLSEGWRIQRDTPGYVSRETADSLRGALDRARRYRDM
jgi:predicted dinucleotide-binding enzyme